MRSVQCGVVSVLVLAAGSAMAQQGAAASAGTPKASRAGTPAPGVAVHHSDQGRDGQSTSGATRLLQRLAGEWEGQVQVRGADGMTSASVISASNRLEQNGSALASCLTGFAFGKPFEGGAALRLDGSRLTSAWADGATPGVLTGEGEAATSSETGTRLVGSISRNAATERVEQTISMSDENHYVLEVRSVSAQGRPTMLVRLDMTRLAPGRLAAAHDAMKDAPQLERARSAAARTAQASAEKDQ